MMELRNRQMGRSANRRGCSFILVLLCLLVLSSGCSPTSTPTGESVRFTLVADSASAPLLSELVSAYLRDRPHASIQVERAANTEQALAMLQAGRSDLVSVSYLPEGAKAAGELWYLPFARDSIVMITHTSNPVGGVTLLQLRSIFQGQTLFWSELGGADLDLVPVSREAGSGTRSSFESLVMGGRDVTSTAVVMPSSRAVVEYVSATSGAIGYVSSGWLVPGVNLLAVEGVTPSPAAIEEGRYALARPYFLVAQTAPDDGLAEFVGWVKEGAGREVIQRGYGLAP
jgi:phosphate transport system substrate-binding protein